MASEIVADARVAAILTVRIDVSDCSFQAAFHIKSRAGTMQDWEIVSWCRLAHPGVHTTSGCTELDRRYIVSCLANRLVVAELQSRCNVATELQLGSRSGLLLLSQPCGSSSTMLRHDSTDSGHRRSARSPSGQLRGCVSTPGSLRSHAGLNLLIDVHS